jgi:hypothetical protein
VLGLAAAMTRRGQPNAEAMAIARYLRLGDTQAELRAQLGEEAFAREFAAGRLLTLDDLRTIPDSPEAAGAPPAAAPSGLRNLANGARNRSAAPAG